jgi:hypothetical protein
MQDSHSHFFDILVFLCFSRADRSYDIEFHGYLSNHAKHAVIALDRLEASSERIQEYWDEYTSTTPYGLHLHKVDLDWDSDDVKSAIQDEKEWKKLRGKKQKWQELAMYLKKELDERFDGDTNQLIRTYATSDLLCGLAGALTHGIIHAGWAVDAQSPWMICEGLAYLNFCHLGVNPAKLRSSRHKEASPMESFVRVARTFEAQNLQGAWVDKAKAAYDESFHPELVAAGLQWQLSKVLKDAHPVATDLPSWLKEEKSLDRLWECIYKTTVWLYLATRDEVDGHGNFVVLHLTTSLWGLEQICRVVGEEQVTREALRQFYASTICLLATSGFPSSKALEDIQEEIRHDEADEALDWTPIVKRGIAETEEHNIKLVYVMKELWNRYDRWGGFSEAARSFTLTPNVGPSRIAFSSE